MKCKHKFVLTGGRVPDDRLMWREVVKCKKCGFEDVQPLMDYVAASLKHLQTIL